MTWQIISIAFVVIIAITWIVLPVYLMWRYRNR